MDTALKLGLRNTGTATVTLNDVGAFYLLEALKALFPNRLMDACGSLHGTKTNV